ncbi:MAG: hypothetical protein ABSF69_09230 [Polyangiaceae bacterium]
MRTVAEAGLGFTGAFTRGSSVQRHAVAKGTEGNRAGAAQEK